MYKNPFQSDQRQLALDHNITRFDTFKPATYLNN